MFCIIVGVVHLTGYLVGDDKYDSDLPAGIFDTSEEDTDEESDEANSDDECRNYSLTYMTILYKSLMVLGSNMLMHLQ
jgi:hypothetical protein